MIAWIKDIPIIREVWALIKRRFLFPGSEQYWINRYRKGGKSGPGSYNELAEYKAEIINDFVEMNDIKSIIEFGCGDGNQLKYSDYPRYLGIDVSPNAIDRCNQIFRDDSTKSFLLLKNYRDQNAELGLSLDVIYHLVEDEVFDQYMEMLFSNSKQFVIIYSSNLEETDPKSTYIKHRKFTNWIAEHKPEWELFKFIKNRYPFDGDPQVSSWSDFYIFKKI